MGVVGFLGLIGGRGTHRWTDGNNYLGSCVGLSLITA